MMRNAIFAAALAVSTATFGADGDYVTLLGANSGNKGESTFVTNILRSSYGWSDFNSPHSGADYYCGYQICTPKVRNGSFEFQGDSLALAADMRFLERNQTITVHNMRLLDKARFVITSAWSCTLDGDVTVEASSSSPAYFITPDVSTMTNMVVSAKLKGGPAAYAVADSTLDDVGGARYVELDDASDYAGTFDVRHSGLRLKLFSDMAGTVKLAEGAILEIASRNTTVGALSLSAGAALEIPADGALYMTNSFSMDGVVSVSASASSVAPRPLITLPANAAGVAADAFDLSGSKYPWRTWMATTNGRQTLWGEQLSFSDYGERTGHVTMLDGGNARNAVVLGQYWSDGHPPHSDTNYYTSAGVHITTNTVFNGGALTIGATSVRMDGEGTSFTVVDFRVSSGRKATSGILTTSGTSSGRSYLHGEMTVLSRITDTWPFAFFGSDKEGQTWTSFQTIHGDAKSALVARGHFSSAPGSVNNYVELLGDLSDFRGTMIVQTNETLRLGSSAFPGAIRLDTIYSRLETVASNGAVVAVGSLSVLADTSLNVASTNMLVVSSLGAGGTLAKRGDGILAFAASTPAVGAVLQVEAGGVKPLAAGAVGTLGVAFAAEASLVLDAQPTDGGLLEGGVDFTGCSVTAAGGLKVVVEADDLDAVGKMPLCTLTSAQAEALIPAMSAAAVNANAKRNGRIMYWQKDGAVVVGADFNRRGLYIVVH